MQLTDVEHRARALGLDLFGVVDAARFDASQASDTRCGRLLPHCGTAIVLASSVPRVVDATAAAQLAAMLAVASIQVRAALPGRCGLSFACLGEAAGLGIVSPVIHRLLHPRYGPRVTVYAVLLLPGRPFGPIADASIASSFHPCCHCPQPCVAACPAAVHDGLGASDQQRCHAHRDGGGCADSCSVVRACPVGAEHAVEPAAEALAHRLDGHVLARRYGGGLWGRVRRMFWC